MLDRPAISVEPTMFSHLKGRRTRRHIVALLKPLTSDAAPRSQPLESTDWLKPFAIGFMGTLITSVALLRDPRLSQSALGHLQCSTWEEITGLDGHLFSNELCLLSASSDPLFEEGCAQAHLFFPYLLAEGAVDPAAPQDVPMPGSGDDARLARCWQDMFELPLMRL